MGLITSLLGGDVLNDYNTQAMQRAHEYELENFRLQNARQDEMLLNSPRLSIAGMRSAGLNPAFTNGPQTPNVGNPSSSASPLGNSMPSISNEDMTVFSQNSLLQSQKANLDADTARKIALLDPEKAKLLADTAAANASANQSNATADQVRQMTPALLKQTLAQSDLLTTQNFAIANKLTLEMQQIAAYTCLLMEQTNTEVSKQKELESSANELVARMGKYQYEIELLKSQKLLTDEEASQVYQLTQNAAMTGNILDFEKQMWDVFPPKQRANFYKASSIIGMGKDIVTGVASAASGSGALMSGVARLGGM